MPRKLKSWAKSESNALFIFTLVQSYRHDLGAPASGVIKADFLHHLLGCVATSTLGRAPLDRDEVQKALDHEGDSRGFDGVAVGLDLPEEYGFLLEKDAFDMYTRRPISNTFLDPLKQLIAKKSEQVD